MSVVQFPPGSHPQAKEVPFPVIDASGIFAPLEPIQYVIRGIDLCPGAPAMWAGYGYSAKTLTAQSAALAIAGNVGKAWGCFDVPQGRVLHLDYEQGSRLTRERYQRLALPMMLGPADLGDRLALSTMPPMYLDNPKAEKELEQTVKGYTLVIIDSLRAACPTMDENSSDARRVLDMLSRVSERTGATFIVIHHARKPNVTQAGGAKMAIRGSGALYDACGSVLIFEAEKGQPIRISHEKARTSGILCGDFEIEVTDIPDGANPRAGLLVTASGAQSREDAAEDAARDRRLAQLSKLRTELTELFQREPEQGGADSIATKLGRGTHPVRGALALMIEAGDVFVDGQTKSRRHRWVSRE